MTDRLHLRQRYRKQVEALLREHAPGIEVWAYGSRVAGGSHDASDLDLVLRGPGLKPVPAMAFVDLTDAFERSNIPILVDTHDWARLPESFHREIERAHVVIQPSGPPTDCRAERAPEIARRPRPITRARSS